MSRSGIYDLKYGFIPDDDVPQEPLKQTNADRIRAMTDEELAELFLIRADCDLCPNKEPHCSDDCKKHWLEWLKQEAET